jgi:double-stranded uracil-DNA glycosylase
VPSYDVPEARLPLALADAHRGLAVGDRFEVRVPAARIDASRLHAVFVGAGFAAGRIQRRDGELVARLTRLRTLPDYVAPRMRMVCVGLNPSEYSADYGTGFARPGNRFWPAMLAAGLVSRERDSRHALTKHHIGMTDLVKRATPRADALSREEFRTGTARVEAVVEWLRPRAVCIVGLTGWRHAVDRRAEVGWQTKPFGNRPVYVMPNTSGLNARVPLAAFVQHLQHAAAGPAR